MNVEGKKWDLWYPSNLLVPRAAIFADDFREHVSSDDSQEPDWPSPNDETSDREDDTYKDQTPNLVSASEVNKRGKKMFQLSILQ